MISDERVQELLGHYGGWDRMDIDDIAAPLADDVTFYSPFVTRYTEGKSDCIVGKPAVRKYMADALKLIPGIRYDVDKAYVSIGSLVVIWIAHFPDGTSRDGADVMRVNEAGRIVDLRSHYTWDPSEVLH